MLFLLVCDNITKCRPHEFPQNRYHYYYYYCHYSNSKKFQITVNFNFWQLNFVTNRENQAACVFIFNLCAKRAQLQAGTFKTFSCRPESHRVYSNCRPGPRKLIIRWRSRVSSTSCNWLKDGDRAAECTLRAWRNLFCVHIRRTGLAWECVRLNNFSCIVVLLSLRGSASTHKLCSAVVLGG